MKTKLIVCLFGGPGAGKSTTCASLFARFKENDYNAEMNREYIKEWIWEGRQVKPADQNYIFAKTARRERLYMEKGIQIIISDSPLLLTHFYGMKFDKYEQEFNTSLALLEQHHAVCKDYGYKTEHIFLTRTKTYNPEGRFQNEEEAKLCDDEMREMLNRINLRYIEMEADKYAAGRIYEHILGKYE